MVPFDLISAIIGGVVTAIEAIVTGIKDVIRWLGNLGLSNVKFVARAPPGSPPPGGQNPLARTAVRAAGGPIIPGLSYLVGERGAERFTSAVPGTITPNNQLGGGARPINLTVIMYGTNATVDEAVRKISRALKTAAV
jgi:hypothetical protein